MSYTDFKALHRLHLVDSAIVEIRKRAAALDPGRALQAEIAKLQAEHDQLSETYRLLHGEQADLELQQRTIDTKVMQIEKDLYGGKVVNPREVENLGKDIEGQKRKRNELDTRILELMDLVPKAQAAADRIAKHLAERKSQLHEHHKTVVVEKTRLEEKFKEVSAKRGEAAKGVPPALLSRYEAIRNKAGGVGMAEVVRGGFCGMCGTHLPEKLIEGAKEGRVVLCESCHRILYASEGIV